MFTDCIFCAQYEETNEDVAFVYAYLRHTIRRWRVEYDEFTSVLMDESKYCWLDPSGCGSYRNPIDLIYQDELPDLSSDELCPDPTIVICYDQAHGKYLEYVPSPSMSRYNYAEIKSRGLF